MAALTPEYQAILRPKLEAEFVPHLPPPLAERSLQSVERGKKIARAFSGFVLHKLLGIATDVAAKSVIDDWGDLGIDAIYYHAPELTLYLVQSKMKADGQVTHDEALAFCEGVRKLVCQDLDEFNLNVQNRRIEIEGATEICRDIALVVAHTGSGITQPAKNAIRNLLADRATIDDRLRADYIDYDASCVARDLLNAQAISQVDVTIRVEKCTSIQVPRLTYFGIAKMADLAKLHQDHGIALYAKNIRTYLGQKTNINESIRHTLETDPEAFFYLNNGVTALCDSIAPGANRAADGTRGLRLAGMSIINGAQTIASAAELLNGRPGIDISTARVSITIIEAAPDDDFGKEVTKARNHQNPVTFSNFVALDDEQERLRRALAYLNIHYVYKAGEPNNRGSQFIRVDEAAQALALFHNDPRFVLWLKKEPTRLLDTNATQYRDIFNPALTAHRLANAVRYFRYTQRRTVENTNATAGVERLINKHGSFAIAWILAKRIQSVIDHGNILTASWIGNSLSRPYDNLRSTLYDHTEPLTTAKGPLALFRNQTDLIPLLRDVMIEHYDLSDDQAVIHKLRRYDPNRPNDIFDYLIQKAPQIENIV